MGAGASKQGVWRPSPAAGPKEKVVSKSGFDVTPLTQDQREKEAAGLSDFQRCGGAGLRDARSGECQCRAPARGARGAVGRSSSRAGGA